MAIAMRLAAVVGIVLCGCAGLANGDLDYRACVSSMTAEHQQDASAAAAEWNSLGARLVVDSAVECEHGDPGDRFVVVDGVYDARRDGYSIFRVDGANELELMQSAKTNAQAVLLHEMGHMLGIAHIVSEQVAVMRDEPLVAGQHLTSDDADAFFAAHPELSPGASSVR
jgi:hypothetical protein